MTTEKKTNIQLGCSNFTNLLTVAFIVLKIADVEPFKNWNWLLVFSPTLILFGIALLIAMVWAAIIMRKTKE